MTATMVIALAVGFVCGWLVTATYRSARRRRLADEETSAMLEAALRRARERDSDAHD